MSHNLFHRSLSIVLAALLTLATMSGLDRLAQPDEPQGPWARAAAATRVVQNAPGASATPT